MADKKRNKIQGAWANYSTKSRTTNQKDKVSVNDESGTNSLNKTNQNLFKFENVELKKEPLFKTINDSGEYIISEEPNGQSKIILITNFIDSDNCKWMFDQIKDELSWKQHEVQKKGATYLQPRMTAWIGNVPYSYSGVTHKRHEIWNPLLTMLKDTIENRTGRQYNSVLANLYRDGHDHVPWHCDDEEEFGSHPSIASLSFGDTRTFELRRKPYGEHLKNVRAEMLDDSDYLEYIKVPLDAGSLLLMEGAVQLDWQHRITREYHDKGPRINLTFRYTIEN